MKKTLLVQVYDGPSAPDHVGKDWRPWINVEESERDTVVAMAAHRHVRNRGGLTPGESHTLTVYHVFSDEQPLHADGTPAVCMGTTFKITNE